MNLELKIPLLQKIIRYLLVACIICNFFEFIKYTIGFFVINLSLIPYIWLCGIIPSFIVLLALFFYQKNRKEKVSISLRTELVLFVFAIVPYILFPVLIFFFIPFH